MQGKIRILHVLPFFYHGGTERLMLDILSRLPKDVYDITAVCYANHGLPDVMEAYNKAGVKTGVFARQEGPRLFWDMVRYLKRERFHVVHTHHHWENLYVRLGAILSMTPIIMTYQHNWPGEEKGRHRLAFRVLNYWTYRNIAVSETLRRYYVERVGISAGKVVTVHNGIDLRVFRPLSSEQRLCVRESLDLPPGATVVGTAGRMVDWKRFDLFLKAASVVLHTCRDAYFLVVGDGEQRESLVQLVHQLGLVDRVRFLGWRLDIPAIYQAMDVFCMTSDAGGWWPGMMGSEGFGLVSIEAMASGLPLVAVDNGVNREVISGECGLFCLPTSGSLAEGVCRLIDDVSLRHRLGQSGRARVTERFDIAQTAAQLSHIYFRAVRERFAHDP